MKLSVWDEFCFSVGFFFGNIWDQVKAILGGVAGFLRRDGVRIVGTTMLASLFLAIDEPLAIFLRRPELAPWFMFAGLALYGTVVAHIVRRIMFSYLNMGEVAAEARKGNTGAGLVFLGVCFVLGILMLMMTSLAKADTLPPQAYQYIPVLKSEQQQYWPDMPKPTALAAQVEQETCPSLKSRQCWNPRAELRTSRERGVGLGQVTRTARFDTLAELKKSYPTQLAGWSWDNNSIYDPHLQLRGLVLGDLRVWRVVLGAANDHERLAMTLAAYNGGVGGLLSDRKLCAATPHCDSRYWFSNVAKTSLKQKTVVSGYGQSFFDINRGYVTNILGVRLTHYEGLL